MKKPIPPPVRMITHFRDVMFKITPNKFSLGSIERHKSEKGVDNKRLDVYEKFKFTGYTINFLTFEIKIGTKIYIDYTA